MSNIKRTAFDCAVGGSVEATLELIGSKWKGVILYHLWQEKMVRFRQLQRLLRQCSQRTLTNPLRALEQDGFIVRKVYAEVSPKVEYSFNQRGLSLTPVLMALK